MSPTTCTTSIPGNDFGVAAPAASGATTAVAIESQPEQHPQASSSVADGISTLVACGDGGCAVLLHLPRRHRRGQGRRREDDGDGRARGQPRPAPASSVLIVEVEGKSGLPAMFDAARARATTRSTSTTGSGPASSLPTPRSSTTSKSHGMKRISKRLASSGALEVVATAVPGHEGHPRARQGEVARGGAHRRPASSSTRPRPATRSRSCSRRAGCSTRCGSGPIRKQAADVVDAARPIRRAVRSCS